MITYKYKLYRNKRTRHIDGMLEEARLVWNHTLALQKRYYRLYGKFVPRFTMIKHIGKTWNRKSIGSQMLQEIVERQDKAYRRFFDHQAKRPPKFKKKGEMHSVVYKQCGKHHDRDVNAAINILRKGISELESDGKSIPASQVGSHACI